MKKLILFLLLITAAVVFAGETYNYDGDTIRFRTGTILKFDASTSLKDEDAAWTITQTELSYIATLTSDAQTQINAKLGTTNGTLQSVTLAGNTTNSIATASRVAVYDAGKRLTNSPGVSDTELEYLDGVTSAVQTQINAKLATTNGVAEGLTLSGSTTNSALTASLPVWTSATKTLASQSVADTKVNLGIQSGKMTNAVNAQTLYTNTFEFPFSAVPVVTAIGNSTNDVPGLISVSTNDFVIETATTNNIVNWIAIGAP